MEKIVSLAKARGFVYPGSEIYGGLANTWDYGNLGVELKNNVKKAWWQKFVQESPYNVGVDCAILMNPQTWVASGHLGGFSDPLMDCKECHERFRADKLIEDWADENSYDLGGSVDGWTQEQMKNFIDEKNICCPSCGKHNFTDIRQFNLMFKTFQGVTEDAKNTVYLRPETAQFLNSRQLMEINVEQEEREELDMCKALEDIYNDGVQAGMEAGIEQGRQSGIAEGEAHGKELGITEGKELGKASTKHDIAFQMQKLGYPLDAIAEVLMESLDSVHKILSVVG